MGYTIRSLEDLGLPRDVSDRALWRKCQAEHVVLITANRNDEGPDSLETTLRELNKPDCLPVVTLADPDRNLLSGLYAQKVAERILEDLLDIETLRGTGRLYVP